MQRRGRRGACLDAQKVIELLIAGGLAGLITALSLSLKAKRDADRDDRRQRAEEEIGAAATTKTIADAAGAVVKLQDDQIEELKRETRALQSEVSALNTRLNIEIQDKMRLSAKVSMMQDRIDKQDSQIASVNAQFELSDRERQRLEDESHAMKSEMFKMSVGVQTLSRQLREVGVEPAYKLDVPPIDRTPSGRLGALDSARFSA